MTFGEAVALVGLMGTLLATIAGALNNSKNSSEIMAKLNQVHINQMRQKTEIHMINKSIENIIDANRRQDEELEHVRESIRDLSEET
jgi:ABC-type transporter Mla subunit MlaD